MEQFRPNLGGNRCRRRGKKTPRKVIRHGSVIFDVVKPCNRCIFTTVSPGKGQNTLLATAENAAIVPHRPKITAMSISARTPDPRSSGVIRVGDDIGNPRPRACESVRRRSGKKMVEVGDECRLPWIFTGRANVIRGNNQQVLLLEQLEQAGIRTRIPVVRGNLRMLSIKLVDGEVTR